MRKFLAIVSAVLLAIVLSTLALLIQNGVSLSDTSPKIVYNVWRNLLPAKTVVIETKDESPSQPAVEPEPNLSYDERMTKGQYYFERGFLTFASNEFVKAANLSPKSAEPYLMLLKTNYELGDYTKAMKNAELVLDLDPNNYETRLDLAKINIKLSDFDTATSLIGQLPTKSPPDARVDYYRGLLQVVSRNDDLARKSFKKALLESKDDKLTEDIKAMIAAYTEFDFAQAADALFLEELLAKGLNKVGEFEMSINLLKAVLQQRGDLRDAWILFGFAYLNLEKYSFALTAFEKAYELDSEWPVTQYFLGLTHKELGNQSDAIVYFNYALSNQFEPKLVLYQNLADLYLDTQDYEKAVSAYEEILHITNDDINAFVRPIWIYLDFLQRPKEALRLAQVANALFPDSAMSFNLLGWSQIGTDEQLLAEQNLKKAMQLDPNMPAPYLNLGTLYEVQKKTEVALQMYQKAYELDQNGSIGTTAAQKYNDLLANH